MGIIAALEAGVEASGDGEEYTCETAGEVGAAGSAAGGASNGAHRERPRLWLRLDERLDERLLVCELWRLELEPAERRCGGT